MGPCGLHWLKNGRECGVQKLRGPLAAKLLRREQWSRCPGNQGRPLPGAQS